MQIFLKFKILSRFEIYSIMWVLFSRTLPPHAANFHSGGDFYTFFTGDSFLNAFLCRSSDIRTAFSVGLE